MRKGSLLIIFLISALFLSTLLSLGLQIQTAKAEQYFNDDFNTTTLDSGWTVIDPAGGSTFSLSTIPGYLTISTSFPPDRDLWQGVNFNAPRVIQPIYGNFSVETKVLGNFNTSVQSAGIVIWKNENNYLRLERANRFDYQEIVFAGMINGIYTVTGQETINSGALVHISNINPTYLRISRDGNIYSGYYSSNEVDWIFLANLTLNTDYSMSAGLYNVIRWAPSFSVSFDYFRMTSEQNSNTQVSEGLVGYWKFDEGSGTVAYDSSGFGNNGALVGGPSWVDGKFGKALSFDGIDDYVTIPDSPILRIQTLTISVWVNLPVRPYLGGHLHNHYCIINKMHYQGTSAKAGYKLDFEYPTSTDDTLVLTIGDGVAQRFLIQYNSINDLTLNSWHHIAATYDGTTAKLHIDGQLKATNTASYTILNDGTPLCIAREVSQPEYDGINGKIDEVKIYNKALTAQEIELSYEAVTPGPSTTPTPTSSPSPSPSPSPKPSPTPSPIAPTSKFTFSPDFVQVSQMATFDASSSSDPDGQILNYQWDFGDGTAIFKISNLKLNHQFSIAGTYSISLTVFDSQGLNHTSTQSMTVVERVFSQSIKFEIDDNLPNNIRVTIGVKYEIDQSPVGDATVKVNQITANHIGRGEYVAVLSTLLPYLRIDASIERTGSPQIVTEATVYHKGNIAMWTLTIVISLASVFMIRLFLSNRKWNQAKKQLADVLKKNGRITEKDTSELKGIKLSKTRNLLEVVGAESSQKVLFIKNQKEIIFKSTITSIVNTLGSFSFEDLGSKINVSAEEARIAVSNLLKKEAIAGSLTSDGNGFITEAKLMEELEKGAK